MPLYAHNGKLVNNNNYKLRGCCCCTWKLSAASYTMDGEEDGCHSTVDLVDPDLEKCHPGTLQEVALIICQAIDVITSGLGLCCPSGGRVHPTLLTYAESGNTAHATARATIAQCHDGSVDFNFSLDFVRATA